MTYKPYKISLVDTLITLSSIGLTLISNNIWTVLLGSLLLFISITYIFKKMLKNDQVDALINRASALLSATPSQEKEKKDFPQNSTELYHSLLHNFLSNSDNRVQFTESIQNLTPTWIRDTDSSVRLVLKSSLPVQWPGFKVAMATALSAACSPESDGRATSSRNKETGEIILEVSSSSYESIDLQKGEQFIETLINNINYLLKISLSQPNIEEINLEEYVKKEVIEKCPVNVGETVSIHLDMEIELVIQRLDNRFQTFVRNNNNKSSIIHYKNWTEIQSVWSHFPSFENWINNAIR